MPCYAVLRMASALTDYVGIIGPQGLIREDRTVMPGFIRAPDYESGGWKFESFRVRQHIPTCSRIGRQAARAPLQAEGTP